jgi:hypothetical protein
MTDNEYYKNVDSIIEMILRNAAKSSGLDIKLINETAVETTKRIKGLEKQ